MAEATQVAERDYTTGKLVQSPAQRERSRRLMEFVALSDAGETDRRKTDRLGSNLKFDRHWAVTMPDTRSALTANITKSLILHKIGIMTKQDPIPIIEPLEVGDEYAGQLMRMVIMNWWITDGMKMKIREALELANWTRTCAFKIVWDPDLHGGIGNMTADLIPGYRLILDDNHRRLINMEFAGHREIMPRSKAMLFYPEAADLIAEGPSNDERGRATGSAGALSSPLGDPWRKTLISSPNFGTMINNKPVISAFSNQGFRAQRKEDTVQIIELYYRDRTLVEKEVPDKDHLGMTRQEIDRDEEGFPQFDEAEPQTHDMMGMQIKVPMFKLRMKPIMKTQMVRKYPWYRRGTLMMPDAIELEDIAWDGPIPMTIISAGRALEGPWVKGPALDCADMQMNLNVSLSTMLDNLRTEAMRPIFAGQGAQIERNSLLVAAGDVVRVGDVNQVKPFEFPPMSAAWFQWVNLIITLMQKIIGAEGVMQGEATGRVDSAQGYDTLAEIGGSRIVEETQQQVEVPVSEIATIVGWFAQKYYTDKHAIAVEVTEGSPTYEKVSSALLHGSFAYRVHSGSTMAWSESAIRQRLFQELQAGLIDKIEYWKRTHAPGWQEMSRRMLTEPPMLAGPAAAPPPRTRTTPAKAKAGKLP